MPNEAKGLAGLRILSLETRRAAEIAKLIENYGGQPIIAPSMREIPPESNTEALEFARRLAAGDFEIVIFLTGVGIRALAHVVERLYSIEKFVEYLKRSIIVARGPKPLGVLRELGVPIALNVPEPNTWRDVLGVLDREKISVRGKSIAVQEYGEPNPELLAGLLDRGAKVMQVPVYRWAMPENTQALADAVQRIAYREIDVALFTTSVQVVHLLKQAREMDVEKALREGIARITIGSIGPVTSQELREQGIHVDFEPEHPKMGYLVNEAARQMSARKSSPPH